MHAQAAMRTPTLGSLVGGVALGLLLGWSPGAARAQAVEIPSEYERELFMLAAGGGLAGHVAGTDTAPGGAWTARFVVRPRTAWGVEMAYFGSRIPIEEAAGAILQSHGGEGLVRANLARVAGLDGRVEPYVGAGAGFVAQDVGGTGAPDAAFDRSTSFSVPAVAGAQWFVTGDVAVDARVVSRWIADDVANDEGSALSLGGILSVGVAY